MTSQRSGSKPALDVANRKVKPGPRLTADHVRETLVAACQMAGSQTAWAGLHSLSPAYVSDVIHGRREPGASVLAALGIEKIVRYRKSPSPGDEKP